MIAPVRAKPTRSYTAAWPTRPPLPRKQRRHPASKATCTTVSVSAAAMPRRRCSASVVTFSTTAISGSSTGYDTVAVPTSTSPQRPIAVTDVSVSA